MGQKCGCAAGEGDLVKNLGFKCGKGVDSDSDDGFFDLPPGFKEPVPVNVAAAMDEPKELEPSPADQAADAEAASAAAAAAAARQAHEEAEAETARAEAARQREAQEAEERRRAEEERQRVAAEEARRREEAERAAAAAAPAAAAAGGGADPAAVAQLTELGFSESQAQDALRRTNGNTEQALSMLLGGEEAAPPPPPSRQAGQGGSSAIPGMDEKAAQLMAMGFPAGQVRRKLQDANGDVDLAMSMLLSDA